MRETRLEPRHPANAGFTLLEMIITVIVIAILASVAVPNYMQSRLTANEAAMVATMRTVATTQLKFKSSGYVDLNQDGSFEHGTLREMTGHVAVRGTTMFLTPNELPPSIGELDAAGRARRQGYYIAVYLPDATGLGLGDTDALSPSIDAGLSANFWTCVAWPTQVGTSGRHTYFVNQQGEVLKCRSALYSGTTRIPPAGCALIGASSPQHINTNELALDRVGADGFRWLSVN